MAMIKCIVSILLFLGVITTCRAALSCESTAECEAKLRVGSQCIDGKCSNPFVEGCIKTMAEKVETSLGAKTLERLKLAFEGRVCNSDDKLGSSTCLDSDFSYPEIRVHNANWESSIFLAWIKQIILMEVLRVPVSVGLNKGVTSASSFYSPENTLAYSSAAYAWEGIIRSNSMSCVDTELDCVEVMPEVWKGQQKEWENSATEGYIEPIDGGGQVGKINFYIPSFTARNDPSLAIYWGLRGKENREKLAKTFKRPTTWIEYCEEVSDNNCTIDDSVAARYPDENERGSFFSSGSYTGHFRMLPGNTNCTANPNCTGYVIAPPCSWSTYVDQQLYGNDIVGLALDGPTKPQGTYGYSDMLQIWRAANATASNVIMWWWEPEAFLEEFASTNWSFTKVSLPPATEECSEARISSADRCSADIAVRRGSKLGGCENEAHSLQKVISAALRKQTLEQPPTERSPGYQFVRRMKVGDLEMKTLLMRWNKQKIDPYGNDAREAVCSWVIDNMDKLLSFIPEGYPKRLDQGSPYSSGLLYTAASIAGLSTIVIIVAIYLVYMWRETKVMVYSQEKFVRIILLGLLFVSAGAILFALRPTNAICVARNWLITLGYNIELAAILIKISTINRVMNTSKRLKRIKIKPVAMYYSVGALVALALIYLLLWTLISPHQAVERWALANEYSSKIEVSLTCTSKQVFWPYLSMGWHTLLLVVSSVLAFQSRGIVAGFNESRSFGTMIYSHFLFMILRIIAFYLDVKELVQPNVVWAIYSYLLSLDVLVATIIYVLPKFVQAMKAPKKFKMGKRQSISRRNLFGKNRPGALESAAFESKAFESAFSKYSSQDVKPPSRVSSAPANFRYPAEKKMSSAEIDAQAAVAAFSEAERVEIENDYSEMSESRDYVNSQVSLVSVSESNGEESQTLRDSLSDEKKSFKVRVKRVSFTGDDTRRVSISEDPEEEIDD